MMRIYLLPASFAGEPQFLLEGKDAHYLMRVLRLKEETAFAGRDRSGKLWNLVLQKRGKNSCTISCCPAGKTAKATTDVLPSYQGPLPEIHLYQCLCKGKKMEQIIRQTTELGVKRIIPVQSKHSVVDISKKEQNELEGKRSRMQSIVKEAIQQSGSSVMTTIEPTIPLSAVTEDWNTRGLALFFHQNPMDRQEPLSQIISRYSQENGPHAPVAVLIGPEGGLAEEEVSLLLEAGFKAVLLKTNILRAETASVCALAIVQCLMVEPPV